jgi:hypothetical protein
VAPSIAALSKHAFITIYGHAYIWCFAEYAPMARLMVMRATVRYTRRVWSLSSVSCGPHPSRGFREA